MAEAILGLSAYYHDSAATILVDGKLLPLLRKSGLPQNMTLPSHLMPHSMCFRNVD